MGSKWCGAPVCPHCGRYLSGGVPGSTGGTADFIAGLASSRAPSETAYERRYRTKVRASVKDTPSPRALEKERKRPMTDAEFARRLKAQREDKRQ